MKRRRGLVVVLVLALLALPLAASAQTVELTLGSWRVDDVAQVQKLLDAFHAKHPNIRIKFTPTNPPDYNAVLRTQLTGGTENMWYVMSAVTWLIKLLLARRRRSSCPAMAALSSA
jgi:ABC-type glycerol-3-phosphate transport system substrate-binding protein